MTMMELYRDNLIDLLANGGKTTPLEIKKDKKVTFWIKYLYNIILFSFPIQFPHLRNAFLVVQCACVYNCVLKGKNKN